MLKRNYALAVLILLVLNYVQAQDITTNMNDAIRQAQENDKRIMMVFSGSDWCKPCIQLKKEVLGSSIFQDFRVSHLIHLELDFPYSKQRKLSKQQKQHNESLAETYNPEGSFPKVLILDADRQVQGTVIYKKGLHPEDFIRQIENIINT